jgi:hypothetical protein
MKLTKSKLRKIIAVILIVIALVGFLRQQFAAPQAADPQLPESSIAEELQQPQQEEAEEPAPSAEEEEPQPELPPVEESQPELPPEEESQNEFVFDVLDENGSYSSMQEVADYIHTFGKLPPNFITKNKARDLGWESSEGNLWEVAPGMSIGGDRFGNYEGLLPEANGRKWTECDIDFDGGYRNDKRIVFSNDGLIYYTDDHYESFTQLY